MPLFETLNQRNGSLLRLRSTGTVMVDFGHLSLAASPEGLLKDDGNGNYAAIASWAEYKVY